jgi:hypothetical protein
MARRRHIEFAAIKEAAIKLARERGYDPLKPLCGQRKSGWGGEDQLLDIERESRLVLYDRNEPAWKCFWMTALARLNPRPNQPTYLRNNMPVDETV